MKLGKFEIVSWDNVASMSLNEFTLKLKVR